MRYEWVRKEGIPPAGCSYEMQGERGKPRVFLAKGANGWYLSFSVDAVNVAIHGIPTLDMAKACAPEMLGIMEKAMLD